MSRTRQPLSGGAVAHIPTATPAYRDFLNKLRKAKSLSTRDLARKMGTPDELLETREKQLEHFFLDSENPRAGLAKAIERALGVNLEPEDYGWNAEAP